MTEDRKIGLEEWQESRCPDCGGSGEAEVEGGRGEDWHRYIVSCPACGGTGDANAPCVQTCGDIACAVVCKKAVEQKDCFDRGCNGCQNCIDDLDDGMHQHYSGGLVMTDDKKDDLIYELLGELAGIDTYDMNLRDAPAAYVAVYDFIAELHWGGCACRWDRDDKRTATCERHQGWLDVVHECAERAKAAEALLTRIADPVSSPSEGDPAVLRAIARGER